MKPNHTDRNVSTSGVADRGEFQISFDHQAHIMSILRDQLYSDKVLAVLREYSANAWDAHREVGKFNTPIRVTLPTIQDPTLYIRDYGPGISHKDMFQVYAQYGVSTKRSSDVSVGMLGIGSKSGFAYTDSFTITSWNGGKQRIYTALLDNNEKGTLNLLDESDAEWDETGIQIQIPIKPEDIPEFVGKAEVLFQHFKPRPDINISLPPEPEQETILHHGSIHEGRGDWFAVMGCIPYRINLNQLRGINAHNGGAGPHLDRLSGLLFFNIGEVQISASREDLKYSDDTKIGLINKFNDLTDEFVKHTLDKIEEGDFSFWEKRCRAQVLSSMGLPVPTLLTRLVDRRVEFPDAKNYIITYGPKQSLVKFIHVDAQARIVVRDEVRKIDGYALTGFDYVVRANADLDPKPSTDEIIAELTEHLTKAELTGIPVVKISSLPWHSRAKFSTVHKVVNKKHQVKTFVLKRDHKYYGNPWADCWDIEEREPTDDDVFVVLRKFKVLTNTDLSTSFYNQYTKDRAMMSALKLEAELPRVYGYKSTEKAPLDTKLLKGRHYDVWREEYFKGLIHKPGIAEVLSAYQWLRTFSITTRRYGYYNDDESGTIPAEALRDIFTKLGGDHSISGLFRKAMVSRRTFKRVKEEKRKAIRNLNKFLRDDLEQVPESEGILRDALKTYPLFETVSDEMTELCGDNRGLWIDYILLVDQAAKGLSNVGKDSAHDNGRIDNSGLEGEAPRSETGPSELPQPEESTERQEMGRDRGPLVERDNGKSMVEQEIRGDGEHGVLYGTACA